MPVRGPVWTALDGRQVSTDQKVGGSSPSERALRSEAPSDHGRGSFANAVANSAVLGGRYGAGEDVGSLDELVADDVRVHPQRDRGIGMAEPGGDHMHRHGSFRHVPRTQALRRGDCRARRPR